MTVLDFPLDARLGRIEERLTAVERDIAVIIVRLESLERHVPSPWLLVGLVLPLYGVLLIGFAGIFYFLLNYAK